MIDPATLRRQRDDVERRKCTPLPVAPRPKHVEPRPTPLPFKLPFPPEERP